MSTETRSLTGRLQQAQTIYREYPGQFWILVFTTFIDRLGGAMLFPFFSLYLTRKFTLGMTDVGILFGLFSLSGVIGSVVGGALTDRLGRKGMLIFGMVANALSSVLMGVINDYTLFAIVAVLVGILTEAGGPASQALVADLLPEEKRAQGFGILRVVFNLSVTIGPVIGGILATRSYLFLFLADAITSLITAVIAYFTLKETWRPAESGEPQETMKETFAGYLQVLRDNAFLWYLLASVLSALMYLQMNTTLGVYLRDIHGVSELRFSYILSLNAAMVVLFQFSITRWISKYRPLMAMTAGTLLYAVGFAMYGFVGAFWLFLLAMIIITIGEMIVSPVGQAIAVRLAPEDMRGRYMAAFGFSWTIPFMIGPTLAGMVLDNLDPHLLWYAAGAIGVLSALAYFLLELRVGRARWDAIDRRVHILEQLEDGNITAEEAARVLESIGEGAWARLAPQEPEPASSQKVRIQVSDLTTGVMKTDLRLPMGLVNTVLYVGGKFSADLEDEHQRRLREMLLQETSQPVVLNGDRLEVTLE